MRKSRLPAAVCCISFLAAAVSAGCGSGDVREKVVLEESENAVSIKDIAQTEDIARAEDIAVLYRDIYDKALETSTLGSREVMESMVARLGEEGYAAVDEGNQIDMTEADQVRSFCESVEAGEKAELTILVVTVSGGFIKYDLGTEDGEVDIVREYYQYDRSGCLENRSTMCYRADLWQYTEEGYLLFEGSSFSDAYYVIALSSTPLRTALRVEPLDEKCRELNRQYILPAGYERNNLFLTDWDEADFGNLDFYDVFDRFYSFVYGKYVPYEMDRDLGKGAVYGIAGEEFETVIMRYFKVDSKTLQSKVTYFPDSRIYEYRPRGFYEGESSDIPYPEVVNYTENEDGTITLKVNAVYPYRSTSRAYAHETVIRPFEDGSFQYVSNHMITPEEELDLQWHSDRLTKKEWEEVYGNGE